MSTKVADSPAARTDPGHDDPWTPLEDPATRYLAAACLRHGQPVVEVAEVLGMCAEECAALLGVEVDA